MESDASEVSPAAVEQAVAERRSFELDVTTPYAYLHHLSELGEFWLSSDAVIPTFTGWPIVSTSPSGSRKMSARGSNPRLHDRGDDGLSREPGRSQADDQQCARTSSEDQDRFDLTLECIRRHYLDEPTSPLT